MRYRCFGLDVFSLLLRIIILFLVTVPLQKFSGKKLLSYISLFFCFILFSGIETRYINPNHMFCIFSEEKSDEIMKLLGDVR